MLRLNKEELKKIRKALPENAIEKLSELTGLKVSSVKQILFKPERFKKEVIERAVEMAEQNAGEINQIINRASQL